MVKNQNANSLERHWKKSKSFPCDPEVLTLVNRAGLRVGLPDMPQFLHMGPVIVFNSEAWSTFACTWEVCLLSLNKQLLSTCYSPGAVAGTGAIAEIKKDIYTHKSLPLRSLHSSARGAKWNKTSPLLSLLKHSRYYGQKERKLGD